jgi:hypothetical protein
MFVEHWDVLDVLEVVRQVNPQLPVGSIGDS